MSRIVSEPHPQPQPAETCLAHPNHELPSVNTRGLPARTNGEPRAMASQRSRSAAIGGRTRTTRAPCVVADQLIRSPASQTRSTNKRPSVTTKQHRQQTARWCRSTRCSQSTTTSRSTCSSRSTRGPGPTRGPDCISRQIVREVSLISPGRAGTYTCAAERSWADISKTQCRRALHS